MPPEERLVCRFAAEPPQSPLPCGEWADTLRPSSSPPACASTTRARTSASRGSWPGSPTARGRGRTYVPVDDAAPAPAIDLFGYVSFAARRDEDEPSPATSPAWADFTDETADRHPEWKMDLCEEVVGGWRGEGGRVAAMTLVWGVPLVRGGLIATAELAAWPSTSARWPTIASRCWRPTPTARTTSRSALWNVRGEELAAESLYEDDGDDED